MRKRFELQHELGARPIEEARFPKGKYRDSLTKALLALQHIYLTPELNTKVFDLLEERVCGHLARTGRPGMSLWEILVLGVVRMVEDVDYDRLLHIANCDMLVRDIMGLKTAWDEHPKVYSYQSIKDNIGWLDEETLEAINALVVSEGHRLKKKRRTRRSY